MNNAFACSSEVVRLTFLVLRQGVFFCVCNPGCPGPISIDQVGRELTEIHQPLPPVCFSLLILSVAVNWDATLLGYNSRVPSSAALKLLGTSAQANPWFVTWMQRGISVPARTRETWCLRKVLECISLGLQRGLSEVWETHRRVAMSESDSSVGTPSSQLAAAFFCFYSSCV